MRDYEDLELEIGAEDWTEHDLWDESIEIVSREGRINSWTAILELDYGGTMALTDEDPATGYITEETAILCDTSMDGLDWLESDEGKAFHYRLQTVLEKAVFFRNKEKSS